MNRLLCGMVTSALLLSSNIAAAADTEPKRRVEFNIVAQPLAKALNEFAAQAEVRIVFYPNSVKGLMASQLIGAYSPQEALKILLSDSQLKYRFIDARTISVSTPGVDPDARANSESLPEIGSGTSVAEVWNIAMMSGEVSGEASPGSAGEGVTEKKAKKKDNAVEEMIVEKDRIKPFIGANADLPRTIDDAQAYYIFDSKTIERSGALSIQDFLKQRLTMDTTFQTSSQMIPGFGVDQTGSNMEGSNISSINLRGLGGNKTLILVNGRRMAGVNRVFGTGMDSYQPDLNGIPLAAVDRIEVLPSSASAIYGGSAIGGVINVILKQSYTGGGVRFNYDMPSNSNAYTSTANANYGFSFEGGKSRLTAIAQYSTSRPMLLGDRIEFVETGIKYLGARTNNFSATLSRFEGQAIGPTGVNLYSASGNIILDDGTDLGTRFAYVAPGTTSSTPYAQRFISGYALTPSPGYGAWGVKQPLGSAPTVKSISASFNRQMNSWLNVFTEFMVNKNSTLTYYDPVGGRTSILSTDAGSPFRTAQVYVTLASPLQFPRQSTSLTRGVTVGFKAQSANGWTGTFDYTLSKNRFEFDTVGYQAREARLDFNAGYLDLLVDHFTSPVDLTAYSGRSVTTSFSRVDDVTLRLAGPVARWSWGDPTLSIGLQRGKSSIPQSTQRGVQGGGGSPLGDPREFLTTTTFARSQVSDAIYMEGLIPLVTEKNAIPLLRGLELQMAQRMSRYEANTGTYSSYASSLTPDIRYTPTPIDAVNGYGGTRTYTRASYNSHNETFGLKYRPVEDVIFRTSLGTAFLPPNHAQLDPTQTVNVPPYGGSLRNPATGLFYAITTISGGNPDLKPQRSKNFDAGIIYEPTRNLLRGLRLNFEYYKITQLDFISTLSPDEIISIPDLAAKRVTYDPVSGLVSQVDLSYVNLTEYSTTGYDVSSSYEKSTRFGTFAFSLAATHIISDKRQLSVSLPIKDYAGFQYWGGAVKNKANASIYWNQRNWSAGWTTNWFGSYRVNGSPGDPRAESRSPNAPWVLQGSYSIPPQMYHHLFASYTFDEKARFGVLSDLSLQLNIQNVFNTFPPIDVNSSPFFVSPLAGYRLRAYTFSFRKSF